MEPQLGETITLDFIVSSATGAAADADSTPTFEVFENDGDTALTLTGSTIAKRTSKTGNYRVTIPITADNGFEDEKSYNVVASATVSTVAAKAVIGTFQVRAVSAEAGTSICYAPTSATRVIGDNDGGTYSDMASRGGNAFITGENASTGLEVTVDAYMGALVGERLVDTSQDIRYSGAGGHSIEWSAYNWDTASYDVLGTLTSTTGFVSYNNVPLATLATGGGALAVGEPVYVDTSTRVVRFRYKHNVATYNAAHFLSIDYVCVRTAIVAVVPTVDEIATANWEFSISGSQAQTRLEAAQTSAGNAENNSQLLLEIERATIEVLPASYLNGGGTVTVTTDRVLTGAEYVDLYALSLTADPDILLGSIDSLGWAQSVGWSTYAAGQFAFLVDGDVLTPVVVTFICDVSLNFATSGTVTYRFTVPAGGVYATISKDDSFSGAYRVGQTLVPLLALDPVNNYVDVDSAGAVAIQGGSSATPAEIWSYATRTLTEGTSADVAEILRLVKQIFYRLWNRETPRR